MTVSSVEVLSSKVIRILDNNPGPFTLQGSNVYLVGNGKDRILIDTGYAKDNFFIETLSKVLQDEKAILSKVLISHHHPDHVGGVAPILKKFSHPIPVFKRLTKPFETTTIPKTNTWETPFHFRPLEDGQEFEVDDIKLKVLFTPGHCADHVSFLDLDTKELFSGDCILGQGTTKFDDLKAYMESLQLLLDSKVTRIFPGHGPVIEDGKSAIAEYIHHRQLREQQIVNLLRERGKLSPKEMCQELYNGYPKEVLGAAEENVVLHLEKLCKESKVQLIEEGDLKIYEMIKG